MISTVSDVVNRLETLGIPFVYSHFEKAQKPPFMTYLITGGHSSGADSRHSLKYTDVRIELYTEERDFDTENHVLRLFTDVEMDVENVYIKEENMYCTYFDFEFIEKL